MPFIDSKVSVKTTPEQKKALKEGYEKMTEALTQLYGDVLGIAPDHMYIKYAASYDWGWNGSDF